MASRSLRPLPATDFGFRQAHHLLNRAGFGGSVAEVRNLVDMGLNVAVDHLIDYDEIEPPSDDGSRFESDIMQPLTTRQRQQLRRARQNQDEVALEEFRDRRQKRQRSDRHQMHEIARWWMHRLIESKRPFEEKMTLFWHGHFATSYRTIEDSYHMYMQNQLFRTYAAGNFAELVFRIIRDPAMLEYLDNDQNRKRSPNENLARELMELFVLGEGNDYSETDIKQGARALTGYTYRDDEFVFRPNRHDRGKKRILGRTGRFNGNDLVRILLRQRSASEFLCLKLYRFFVNDLPGGVDENVQEFVIDLAEELRDHEYDLKPVVKTLFKSAHFYDQANVCAQIKSPVQLISQTIRSLNAPTRSLQSLLIGCDLMGQRLFFPPTVAGWEGGRAWINTSTLYTRQNMLVFMLTGRIPRRRMRRQADHRSYDCSAFIESLQREFACETIKDTIPHLLQFCFGAPSHPQRIKTLMDFIDDRGENLNDQDVTDLLLLVTAMPEYQLC